jgi:hypothetical protein
MEVASTSTTPVKGVAKAVVAEHLRLNFANKVGPRASNSLHTLCCASDGKLERHHPLHTGGRQCYAKLDTLRSYVGKWRRNVVLLRHT